MIFQQTSEHKKFDDSWPSQNLVGLLRFPGLPIRTLETAWRIIPVSISQISNPHFISHLGHLEAEQAYFRGLTNHGY